MPDLLRTYHGMRNFRETPEPSGGKPAKKKLPMFVIQKHRASHLHYDFRLEMEGVLKSWAIPKGPSYNPGMKRLAMMTEDHPYDYGSFEGVIPEGNYGAGNVIIWDTGSWEFIEPGEDPVKALRAGKLTFRLSGKKMFGEWALVKIRARGKSSRGNEWLLLKHRDEFANEEVDVTKIAPKSVVSNLGVDEIGSETVGVTNRRPSSKKVMTVADALEKDAPKTKKSTKHPPSRARAAGDRSRSSPAGAPRSARPTPRRRPR